MTLPSFTGINLSNNKLSGNIQSLFSTDTSPMLQYIILSNMSLTGSWSDELFYLPSLITLVLSNNHITGTLPASVCTSNLTSLFLDGIGISSTTRGPGFYGSIPSCIFSSNISRLHLAGNALTGPLPEVPESSPISSLTVARNRLTGNHHNSTLSTTSSHHHYYCTH